MRLDSLAMILVSVVLASGSQIVLKGAMTAREIQRTIEVGSPLEILMAIMTSPQVIAGLTCFGVATVVWLFVLSKIPLSSAYPFIALGVLITVLAGKYLFGEAITPQKAIGVGLIMGGIVLVGVTR